MGVHALVILGLNIFMISFLENIDVGASRPGYKRVKYFNGSYFLIY